MAKRKRREYPSKSSHEGKKRLRGVPIDYDELKRQISLMLTPTANKKLSALAEEQGLPRSEFLERLLRGLIPFPSDDKS